MYYRVSINKQKYKNVKQLSFNRKHPRLEKFFSDATKNDKNQNFEIIY